MAAKDKLRNYNFSNVDSEDASFDDSPMKKMDKVSGEMLFAEWCVCVCACGCKVVGKYNAVVKWVVKTPLLTMRS